MDRNNVIIEDSKNLKNVLVQIDLKKQTTMVVSNFSAWDNLAYLLEALGITAQQCIFEGIPKTKVYTSIKEYFMRVFEDYTLHKRI